MVRRSIQLTEHSWLEYDRAWLPTASAQALELELRNECRWQSRSIVLFGREVLQPRLIAWYGDVPYRYSGRTLDPSPMIPPISAITEQVSATCETEFNHVLLNRYRDGNDSMGRHRDDEPELGDAPTVATLSLGARRRFSVYRSKQRVWTEGLGAGDLLVMRGRFQHELAHELPKQRSVKAERISLTFRKIAAGD